MKKTHSLNEVQQLRNLMESMGPGGPATDQRNMYSNADTSSDVVQLDKIDQWCMDNMNQSRASKWNMEAENTLDRYEVEYWTDLERENENAISALIDYAYELGIIDRDLNEDTDSYHTREDWEAEAESRGYEIEYWGNGSAHAYDDAGRDVGTWTAEFDTSSGRATGWFK